MRFGRPLEWLPVTAESRKSPHGRARRARTAKKLNNLARTSGRAPEEIVEDALAGYLAEVASVHQALDSRYDDLKSGRVKPVDGEEVFRRLRAKSERRRAGA